MYLFLLISLLIVLYLFMICPNIARREAMDSYRQLEFAHRGYFSNKEFIPENSLPAFKEAIKRGLGIELDVHLTKDSQIVVFHDDTLIRMCNLNRTIEDMTYEELQQLHLLNSSEKIPLLSEVLHLVNGRVPLLIEIKMPSQDTAVCQYTNRLLEHYQGSYLVQSFNTFALRWFRLHASHVLRGQLSSNLMTQEHQKVLFFAFLVRFLLTNFFCKPDFISYKLKDSNNLSLFLIKHLYKVPIAVWTLRTKQAYDLGKSKYDIIIFEKF